MKEVIPVILKRTRGFKAFAWGRSDDHVMGGRGCNYQFKPIPNQPHQGWVLLKNAVNCLLSQFPTRESLEAWARKAGDGQFLTDEVFNKRVNVDIYEPNK